MEMISEIGKKSSSSKKQDGKSVIWISSHFITANDKKWLLSDEKCGKIRIQSSLVHFEPSKNCNISSAMPVYRNGLFECRSPN